MKNDHEPIGRVLPHLLFIGIAWLCVITNQLFFGTTDKPRSDRASDRHVQPKSANSVRFVPWDLEARYRPIVEDRKNDPIRATSDYDRIVVAVERRNLDLVMSIAERIDVNAAPNLRSAAAHSRDIRVFEYLLERGLIVSSVDVAIIRGDQAWLDEWWRSLNRVARDDFAKGADGRHSVHLASCWARWSVLRWLVERGVPASSFENGAESSPIHIACCVGVDDLVTWLGYAGADVNCHGGLIDSPLMLAIRYRKHCVIGILLGFGANCNLMEHSGRTPLMAAIEIGDPVAVAMLLENGADVLASVTYQPKAFTEHWIQAGFDPFVGPEPILEFAVRRSTLDVVTLIERAVGRRAE